MSTGRAFATLQSTFEHSLDAKNEEIRKLHEQLRMRMETQACLVRALSNMSKRAEQAERDKEQLVVQLQTYMFAYGYPVVVADEQFSPRK